MLHVHYARRLLQHNKKIININLLFKLNTASSLGQLSLYLT